MITIHYKANIWSLVFKIVRKFSIVSKVENLVDMTSTHFFVEVPISARIRDINALFFQDQSNYQKNTY